MAKKLIVCLVLLLSGSMVVEAKQNGRKDEVELKAKKEAINFVKDYYHLKTEQERLDFKKKIVTDIADKMSENLPYRVSDKVSWEKIEGTETSLSYVYKIDDESISRLKDEELEKYFQSYMKSNFKKIMCSNDSIKGILRIGINIELNFTAGNNEDISTKIIFTEKDCK